MAESHWAAIEQALRHFKHQNEVAKAPYFVRLANEALEDVEEAVHKNIEIGEQLLVAETEIRQLERRALTAEAAVGVAKRRQSELLAARHDGEELQEQQEREILSLEARVAELERVVEAGRAFAVELLGLDARSALSGGTRRGATGE